MKYKMIVLDLDGTLTNSKKEISAPTRKALIDAEKKGYKVVLASGRPTPGVLPLAKELELEKHGGYILSYNGAIIIDCKRDEIIYNQTLPIEVIPTLYDIACEENVGIISYDTDKIILGRDCDEYIDLEARINNSEIFKPESFAKYLNYPVNKCLMTGDHEMLKKAASKIKKKYNSLLNVYFSEEFFLEIMPQNIDKAHSLLKLLSMLGLSTEEMICCGDGFNDISMIKIAGLGVAMENAQDVVKEVADYITASNDEDGILKVVEKFMVGESHF